ncbi:MAG: hypothetical protein ACE5GX_11620, partial [Thermoanaerobaculia bacterium]
AADLTVSVFDVTGEGFVVLSAPALPLVVLSGETTQVTIRFKPTRGAAEPVDFDGVLTIISDDPDTASVERTLDGKGSL